MPIFNSWAVAPPLVNTTAVLLPQHSSSRGLLKSQNSLMVRAHMLDQRRQHPQKTTQTLTGRS